MLLDVLNIFSRSASGYPIETAKVRFPAGTSILYVPSASVVTVACGTLFSSRTVTLALATGSPFGVEIVP